MFATGDPAGHTAQEVLQLNRSTGGENQSSGRQRKPNALYTATWKIWSAEPRGAVRDGVQCRDVEEPGQMGEHTRDGRTWHGQVGQLTSEPRARAGSEVVVVIGITSRLLQTPAEEPGGVTQRDRAKDDDNNRPRLVPGLGPGPAAQQEDHDDADPGAEREPGDDVGQQQTRRPRCPKHGEHRRCTRRPYDGGQGEDERLRAHFAHPGWTRCRRHRSVRGTRIIRSGEVSPGPSATPSAG